MAILVAASDAAQAIKDAADFVCDGAYDQEQIEAAMGKNGGRVNLSAGTFQLTSTLTLGDKPTCLVGEGPKSTTLLLTLPASGDGIRLEGRSHELRGFGIVNGDNLRYGVVLGGQSAYLRLDELYIELPGEAGVRGNPSTSQNFLSHVHVRDSVKYGFHLYGVSNTMAGCIASRSAGLDIGGGAGFRLQEVGSAYYGLVVDRHETGYEIEMYAEALALYAPYAERCDRGLRVRSAEENHPQAISVVGGFFYDMRHPTDAAVDLHRVTGIHIDGLRIRKVASGKGIEQGENAQGVSIDNLWLDAQPAERPASKPTDFFTVGQAGK